VEGTTCRLNHDAKKIVTRTSAGSLKLTVLPFGVFVEASVDPATAAGHELAAAMALMLEMLTRQRQHAERIPADDGVFRKLEEQAARMAVRSGE
jgi:hypothetical protein